MKNALMPRICRYFVVLIAPFLAGYAIAAADIVSAKRPIDHADFDSWKSIATPVLSRDGRWLAYSYQPQDGDGELVLRELATGKESREPIGALPPPILTPNEENPDAPPMPRAIKVYFTSDSRFLVATTFPYKAEVVAARKAKKKPEEMPKGGLLVVDLSSGAGSRIANVKSVQVPAKGGSVIAIQKEEVKAEPAKAAEPKVVAAKADADDEASDQAAARAPAPADKKEFGTDLIVRDLAGGSERVLGDVAEYSLSRDGNNLLYTVASKTDTDNGAYLLSTREAGAKPVALLSGKGKYLKLSWDREQTQAAFVSDHDDADAKAPQFKVYHWLRGSTAANELAAAGIPGFPAGMTVSDKGPAGTLAFSRNGKKLYVPAAAPGKAPRGPDAGPVDEEKVTADLWRWNDDVVQSVQKVRATQERNRSYRGVFDLASRAYVQIADAAMRTASFSDDGTRAVGADDSAYRRMTDYDGAYADLYVINTETGARKLAVKQLRQAGRAATTQDQWSPDGKWLVYFQNKHWHLLNSADGSHRNLTEKLVAKVFDEDHDTPEPAGPYGAAGWVNDSSSLLVYDRFDVWQLFVDGRAAKNLTHGVGRNTKIRFRVQRVEPIEEGEEERGFDAAKTLVLRGESEETRATGFYSTKLSAATPPSRLIWGDKSVRYVGRALDADVLMMTAQRFDTFPDLHITTSSFAKVEKVSNGAAQQAPFLWGSGELMPFTSAKGVKLQAALYKPANFDPKKKYPLMVYIYERLSQEVHSFKPPLPSHNINFSQYTSNGYLVMTPDIVYTTGYPGRSAMESVLPAIAALVKQGFVDEKAIGIQGHSWGGYQIAYMVTQTNVFRAAEAGAPVGNMTSAYSGIRWGTGLPRQFQYEQSQSRIGKPLQEAPQLFLANSPVFHAKNVKTPLLILANDNDDAVPWYQGIELFLALRRYQKEAFYFNYNGEFHGLRRRADQKDYARRMQQFFDHYLKGAPAPEWMQKGILFIDRDEEKIVFPKMKVTGAAK